MGSRPAILPDRIRFGDDFELDRRAYQLRSAGIPIKLTPTQMELLLLLMERRGELITREQIVERIWGPGVFVDTDNSINAAVSRIRQVLRDNAAQPQFVETVTGRGYRFVAPLMEPDLDGSPDGEAGSEAPSSADPAGAQDAPAPLVASPHQARRTSYLAVSLLGLIAAGLVLWSLRSTPQPAESSQRAMIAVLPFENLTGDAGQDYFSDGLTEEMIMQLGRVDSQRLGVIGRTSVMHYKNTKKTLDEIGRELGVRYVIEGSVRRDASRVRITAQLIQVKDQTHLWAQEYDRDLQELLKLQAEIAQQISGEIQAALGSRKPGAEAARVAPKRVDHEAYELYLKGQYFWNKRTVEGLQRAIGYFQQAIAKDADYAPSHAALAASYSLLGGYSAVPQADYIAKARAAATRARELDETLPQAHAVIALILQNYDWDWKNAEDEYRRAIELDPNYATAHHWYAEHLALLGRFEEALAESERARQLEPLSLIIAADKGVILYYARQPGEAIRQLRAVQEMDAHFPRASMIMFPYAQEGRIPELLAECERSRKNYGDTYWVRSFFAYAYGLAGRTAEAKHELAKAEERSRKNPVDAGLMVPGYLGTGEKERALAWLEKAYAQHSNVMTTLKVDPLYDPLRGEPRFQVLLRRVGLAE